jgi:hypothetical protein
MAYTATDLVTRSWYLSGIVARNLETVSPDQITDGMQLLNTLLDFKAADLRLIPFFTRFGFNLVTNVEEYFIPNLFQVETLTFNIQTVRYQMNQISRVKYFGTPRVDNIQSLPYSYHVERVKDGSNIFVYFKPNQTYPAMLTGKFGLTNVVIGTDLETLYENFYIEYLRYALAQMMCNEYDVEFSPDKLAMLKIYESKCTDESPTDLSTRKLSAFNRGSGINYGQANLGLGWTVP